MATSWTREFLPESSSHLAQFSTGPFSTSEAQYQSTTPSNPTQITAMAQLLDQAPETLHNIFLYVDPTDLARLRQTCHFLNELIVNDELLWKIQYLSRFDDPPEEEASNWRERTSRVVALVKTLESENLELKNASLEATLSAAVDLITHRTNVTEPSNPSLLSTLLSTPINLSTYLCRSSLFAHARYPTDTPASSPALRQLSARLHVYSGFELEPSLCSMNEYPVSPDPSADHLSTLRTREVHPYARSRVYDLRRYTSANKWGPFADDGSGDVDWEKLQALMLDLAFNLRIYTERRGIPLSPVASSLSTTSTPSESASNSPHPPRRPSASRDSTLLFTSPFSHLTPGSFTSAPLPGKLIPSLAPSLDALDPYGVSGTWMRIVCFLDYNDLYAFNFENTEVPIDVEREPISTREAFRLIRLHLHVTAVEEPDTACGEDGDGPVVHFEGRSRSTYMAWDPNANSRIRGTVRTTPQGHIRWTTFSIFHGEERWRSEGVQIGGRKSARGIMGTWFDKDFDVHGPAGPTAFWKVSDDIVEEKRRVEPWAEMLQILVGA